MFEGLPALPPVDRDGSEQQRETQAHVGVLHFRAQELRRKVQTTIPCLLHSLLSGIQQWMIVGQAPAAGCAYALALSVCLSMIFSENRFPLFRIML
jgi:hypothetical protein